MKMIESLQRTQLKAQLGARFGSSGHWSSVTLARIQNASHISMPSPKTLSAEAKHTMSATNAFEYIGA